MRTIGVLLAFVGACGGGSSDSTDAGSGDAPADADLYHPQTLAATGLCVDAACTQIADGIVPYTPRFELYSDTATKRRWIYLPPGTQIDTSDMDFWQFPVGTKLWKEFTRDGTRVETRLVWRIGAGNTSLDWFYGAFVWNAAQDATHFAELGEPNANGTQHDVPAVAQCQGCHNNLKPSRVLGFSALELDYSAAAGDLDLADLVASNQLTSPPAGSAPYFPFDAANTSDTTNALGYMHANCGHCHNPSSGVQNTTPLQLRLTVGTVGDTATTPTYLTAVNVSTANMVNGHSKIVDPGSPSTSVLIDRFEATNGLRMPAAGTEMMDGPGDTLLKAWISGL